MAKNYSNPCSRCGKERIVAKTYKEDTGYSIVVTKVMVCPDQDCQSKVDADNQKHQDKYAKLKMKSTERMLARRAAIDAARIANK